MAKADWKRWRLPELGTFLISIALAFLIAEGLLRLGIRFGYGRLQNPALYTHPFCDDDYHKLRWLWSSAGESDSGEHVQHPRLGWIPNPKRPRSEPSSAGLEDRTSHQPRVTLFGDSFIAGVYPARPEERIAPLLANKLTSGRVRDLSVAGYGVDQIYLRFQDSLASADDPRPTTAVFGILLDDLDRVIETFRDGPKPYFVAHGEDLELHGVPIEETSETWIQRHPVKIRSFLVALIKRRMADIREWEEHGRTVFEDECRRGEKETLNRRILTRLVQEAQENGIRPVFVIFYSERALAVSSWKEDFLKETLEDLGVAVLDTRALLTSAGGDGSTADFYFPPPNGHLNPQGNALTADAIASLVEESSSTMDAQDASGHWQATAYFGTTATNTLHLLRRGWESDAEAFSWTSSTEATVQLPSPPPGRRVVLMIETLCALRTPDDVRSLSIGVNRHRIHEIPLVDFPECWNPAKFEIDVPETVPLGRMVKVSLHLQGLLMPREAGLDIEDDRRLGVAVRSIGLQSLDHP